MEIAVLLEHVDEKKIQSSANTSPGVQIGEIVPTFKLNII